MQSVEWWHYYWITSGNEVTERSGRGLNWDNITVQWKEGRKYVNQSEWPASGFEVGPPTFNAVLLTNRSPQLRGCLQRNDPYEGRKVLGSIPERCSIYVGQSWPPLYSPVGILDGGEGLLIYFLEFFVKEIKFCNLHSEICRLHKEFNSWLSEQY